MACILKHHNDLSSCGTVCKVPLISMASVVLFYDPVYNVMRHYLMQRYNDKNLHYLCLNVTVISTLLIVCSNVLGASLTVTIH